MRSMGKDGLSFQLEKSCGRYTGWMVVWKRARSWLPIGGRGWKSGVGKKGERRYVGWEVIGEILGGTAKSHEVKAFEDVKWKWGTGDGFF